MDFVSVSVCLEGDYERISVAVNIAVSTNRDTPGVLRNDDSGQTSGERLFRLVGMEEHAFPDDSTGLGIKYLPRIGIVIPPFVVVFDRDVKAPSACRLGCNHVQDSRLVRKPSIILAKQVCARNRHG